MTTDEMKLTAALQQQAGVARVDDRLDDVLADTTTATIVSLDEQRRRPWQLVAVAAAALFVVAALVWTNHGDSSVQPAASGTTAVRFETPQVTLTADHYWIEIGGTRYDPNGLKVDVHSDPGDSTYTTLELLWTVDGIEMGGNYYFRSDGDHWWAYEIRTKNGKPPATSDWVTFTGDHFVSPVGTPWTGTFDQTDTENGVTSHLHIDGMTLTTRFGTNTPNGASPGGTSTTLAPYSSIPPSVSVVAAVTTHT
jgi:hypothetical protein